jgi:CRP-like cAMP-binding protein
MSSIALVAMASLVGLAATSSSILGAALGLYVPISKRVLACILAFAAGSLISALAIDLAYTGALQLHANGLNARTAWSCVGGGFAFGALIYYVSSVFLDGKGAAIRSPTLFRQYAIERKQKEAKERIALLASCDILRHLSPEAIEDILPVILTRHLAGGDILFRAGDPGDSLYIVERGGVDVLAEEAGAPGKTIAHLAEGKAFGEMALLSGKPRTATIRAAEETELLDIGKNDFERLIASDKQMAHAVEQMSHARALSNLSDHALNPSRWADVAASSLHHVTRAETDSLLAEAGKGAGLALVVGNILDTIPACLVIGAKFSGLGSMSLTLVVGMFLGGIPEAAVSGAMLTKAGFSSKAIFGLWTIVLVVGFLAAGAGKLFLGDPNSIVAVFSQGIAGGAVLALIAHTMIPEAIHDGHRLIVLPTVGGFLFALYLSLASSFS